MLLPGNRASQSQQEFDSNDVLTLPLPAGIGGRQRLGPIIAAVCPGRGHVVQTANYDDVT